MSDVAIRVEHLSKAYKIRHQQTAKRYATLREDLMKLPATLMGKLRNQDETFWALDDVSFDIHEGEVVGIIGRNGAGKSTLLKILARITEPTRGRAEIFGRVGSLLEVGTGFHPELTGRENIYLSGAILGMTRAEIRRKFDEIVDFAEVEKFLDTPAKHYSSGMYVRLAFAVAAHLDPEILLVDEVLAVGDAQFQKKCLGKMGEVAQGGRTVLFVSHNMGAVRQLCKRSMLISKGGMQLDASSDKAIAEYLQVTNNPAAVRDIHFDGNLNASLKFLRIEINGTINNGNCYLSPHSDIKISIYGECKKSIPLFRVTFSVFYQEVRLFSVHDVEEPLMMKIGKFISEVTIPKRLLRPGEYSLALGGYRDGMNELIWSRDVLTFTILEEWGEGNDPFNYGIINVLPCGRRVQY